MKGPHRSIAGLHGDFERRVGTGPSQSDCGCISLAQACQVSVAMLCEAVMGSVVMFRQEHRFLTSLTPQVEPTRALLV